MITTTIASVDRGAFLFNFRDGMSRIALWLSPVADLTKALPSLFQNGSVDRGCFRRLCGSSAVASAVAAAAAAGPARSRRRHSRLWPHVASRGNGGGVAGVAEQSRGPSQRRHAAGPALLDALRFRGQSDCARVSAISAPLDPADLPGRLVLVRALTTNPGAGSGSARRLPAAVYEVTGTTAGTPGRPSAAENRSLCPRRSPIGTWRRSAASWKRQTGSSGCRCGTDDRGGLYGARCLTRRVDAGGIRSRDPRRVWRAAWRKRARATDLSPFFSSLATPGWNQGASGLPAARTRSSPVAPDGQSPIQLSVHSGPVDNELTLESGTWRERVALKAGEGRLLQLPTDGRSRATPLKVADGRWIPSRRRRSGE